jgi:hypothetical protein
MVMKTIEFNLTQFPRAIRASNIEQDKHDVYMGYTEFLRRDGFTTIKYVDFKYDDTGALSALIHSLSEEEFILFALKWA